MNPQPSRVGPVVTIVVSALAMVFGPIIGMVVMAGVALNSMDPSYFEDAQVVSNGASVQISNTGDYAIVPGGESTQVTGAVCTVTDSNGADIPTRTVQTVPVFTADSSGQYTISCDTSDTTVVVIPAGMITQLVDNASGLMVPFVIGGIVGFLGLVGLIVGIVWLVKVNGRRRQLQQSSPGYGMPYQQGYQQPWQQQGYQQPTYGQPYGQQSYPQPSTPPGSTPQAGTAPTSSTQNQAPPKYGERIYPPTQTPSEPPADSQQ